MGTNKCAKKSPGAAPEGGILRKSDVVQDGGGGVNKPGELVHNDRGPCSDAAVHEEGRSGPAGSLSGPGGGGQEDSGCNVYSLTPKP